MILWSWDEKGESWREVALETGKTFSLSPNCQLLPLQPPKCCLLSCKAEEEGRVTVNGMPPLTLRMLDDRDEICLNSETVYFSTEASAKIVSFADDTELFCGRCKGKMAAGAPAVRCPRCGAWHHETEALHCWTYDSRCSCCELPTAGVPWEPEPLRKRTGWGYRHEDG